MLPPPHTAAVAVTTNPSRFSHAQAPGGVAAAISGTVKAAWPISWADGAATAAVLIPDKGFLPKLMLLLLLYSQGLAARQFFSAARPHSLTSLSHCQGAFFPSSEIH